MVSYFHSGKTSTPLLLERHRARRDGPPTAPPSQVLRGRATCRVRVAHGCHLVDEERWSGQSSHLAGERVDGARAWAFDGEQCGALSSVGGLVGFFHRMGAEIR